jgi:hypothetical protein
MSDVLNRSSLALGDQPYLGCSSLAIYLQLPVSTNGAQ